MLTFYNNAIKPSIIDQYKAELKNRILERKINNQCNFISNCKQQFCSKTAEFDAKWNINTNTNVKVLIGETTSKGIELDVTYFPIDDIKILAGYSYNDIRYTKTTGATGSFIEGDRLVRTPQHTANMSFFYTIPVWKIKRMYLLELLETTFGDRLGGWNNQVNPAYPNGIRDREFNKWLHYTRCFSRI